MNDETALNSKSGIVAERIAVSSWATTEKGSWKVPEKYSEEGGDRWVES